MRSIVKFLLLILIIQTILLGNDEIRSKELYLEYMDYPKRVFTNQKFHITLKATILKETTQYDHIEVNFTDDYNLEILNKDPQWIKHDENIYTVELQYKAKKEQFKLPSITVALILENEIIEYISIKPPSIKFEKIAINQNLFSNVIASKLDIISIRTKQFDNKSLLSTINIEAKNSNLENLKLNKYNDQGIKSLEGNYSAQNLFFYTIIPIHEKEIKFTYYNTNEKDFVTVSIPVDLKEELVSTQTDLNPYNDSMVLYKKILVTLLLLIAISLYTFTRKNIYIFISTVFLIMLAYLFIPNKKIILNKGENIYILPTKNSTLYNTLKQKEIVEIINQKENYKKVLFKNQNIGWIKENDSK
ncbi:MAG: hypothetical protein U9Q33_03095 [Campylobacterota bacterium]|nr:hypothetical protein [Campylobacterota bacterium]